MKKLLSILFFILFLCGLAEADEIKIPKFNTSFVFYCIDNLVTGMDGEYKSTKEYIPERFNVKFDSENQSEIIVDGKGFSQTGTEALRIYIDAYGSIIRFYTAGEKLGYYRSRVFGMSDAIFVANGECEKF